jgi:hypothetical protein
MSSCNFFSSLRRSVSISSFLVGCAMVTNEEGLCLLDLEGAASCDDASESEDVRRDRQRLSSLFKDHEVVLLQT